jgi:hypothetical protein
LPPRPPGLGQRLEPLRQLLEGGDSPVPAPPGESYSDVIMRLGEIEAQGRD